MQVKYSYMSFSFRHNLFTFTFSSHTPRTSAVTFREAERFALFLKYRCNCSKWSLKQNIEKSLIIYKKKVMTPVITAAPSVPRPKIRCVGMPFVWIIFFSAATIESAFPSARQIRSRNWQKTLPALSKYLICPNDTFYTFQWSVI